MAKSRSDLKKDPKKILCKNWLECPYYKVGLCKFYHFNKKGKLIHN